MLKNHFFTGLLALSTLSLSLLTACQAPIKPAKQAAPAKVSQESMKIKTRASSFVYLTPIPKDYRTVFIAIENDSGIDTFDIQPWLVDSLQEKSFRVVHNLDEANLVLRANVLRIGKIDSDNAPTLLDSEFGNSAQNLVLTPLPGSTKALPNNEALVLDLQYFERSDLINPLEAKPRSTMENLTDIQLLMLCNTSRWERFQTRIVSIIFDNHSPLDNKLNALAQSSEKANSDIVRGLS